MTDALSPTLFERIRGLVQEAQGRAVRAVNRAMVELYWSIGRTIVEDEQGGAARAAYGEALIDELAARLTAEFGKGFNAANLRNMRQFFLFFPRVEVGEVNRNQICYTLRSELSWSHYRLLMRVGSESAREWYMNEAADAGWSVRALERQIGSHYYERLLASRDRKPVAAEAEATVAALATSPAEEIKDPYVFEFLGLPSGHLLERDLEAALLDNLQAFLLELGRGFSFVARQYRVATETSDCYIDLVFYHYLLKCFVIVDLKTGALQPQDIGQMDMYVRLFDDKVRQGDDRPTVGLELSSHKDETIVRYSVLSGNERLFASEYRLHLPSEEELRRELTREREAVLRRALADAEEVTRG